MTRKADKFDNWIRGAFVDLNTELEELYFSTDNPMNVDGVGDEIKQQIFEQGNAHIIELLDEGNTDEGFDGAFNLLGNLGLYFGALRRHEMTNPETEQTSPFVAASALGLQIAASLGVAPRFASSHLESHNKAIKGKPKSFTWLPDEQLFNEYNTRGILCFKRAADALTRVLPLGVSHPVTGMLLEDAKDALAKVITYNKALFNQLDIDRFFFCVRPYYKSYRVGKSIYRGANAGDISGINQIDMLLGLCRANDAYYSQILVEKMLYMLPEDQASMRDCMRRVSLLDEFLALADDCHNQPWFQENLTLFLQVCDMHGATAQQHHNLLVKKFVERPAKGLDSKFLKQLTASGPPLPKLMQSLTTLRDLRMAAKSTQTETRYNDIKRLRGLLG
ncbi:hypothetical protein MNBD_ALPHA06-1806 [hydrothermal vent metagenome]|uniref:Indoleamine 2,3-dioxygenase n=1 Tax=hydrothermal vent metagenome TaxID=652676 RepID=A0A3B0R4P3_9ZZZZ